MSDIKFKIDENLPVEVAEIIIEKGYNASTINQENLSGISDIGIAEICKKEGRTLITLDMDFSDIRMYLPKDFYGLIILRLKKQDKYSILKIMQKLIGLFPKEPLKGHLWIVEDDKVRIVEGN